MHNGLTCFQKNVIQSPTQNRTNVILGQNHRSLQYAKWKLARMEKISTKNTEDYFPIDDQVEKEENVHTQTK